MKKQLQLLCAAAASLLAGAAQAALLTVAPATLSAYPGETVGWGFSLTNDDAANYLLVTGTEFLPTPLSAFGSYTDLLGTRWTVLNPGASLTEVYDALLGTGFGAFSLAEAAEGALAGDLQLHYALFSVSPDNPDFNPDVDLVTADASVSASASVQRLPEPATWALAGLAGVAASFSRRARKLRTA